jgi:phosphate-selective porin OprO/OprP
MMQRWIAIVVCGLALGAATARADEPASADASPPAPSLPATLPANGDLDCILPPPESQAVKLESYWDNGYHIRTADKQFRLHIGGNVQWATTWLIGPNGAFIDVNNNLSGIDNAQASFLRRARFRMDGQVWSIFEYMVEYDFANAVNDQDDGAQPGFANTIGTPSPTQVWMQIRETPYLGTVRIGNQKKPIGMANNTAQALLPFIERADNMDAFYGPFDNGYALGVSSRHVAESELATWQFGIYQPTINLVGTGSNDWAVGSRLTGVPIYEDDGCRLIHTGVGMWISDVTDSSVRTRARTALRNGPGPLVPILVDTGFLDATAQFIVAPEFGAVYGPWTFQAEYAAQFINDIYVGGTNQGTGYFHGGYAQLLYFLTGEHDSYNKETGAFGRVVPRNNLKFSRCNGCESGGAWQLGARLSYIDLTNDIIDGGNVYDLTLGVNWFLNPNMKLQLNYILERRDAPQNVSEDWINGIGLMAAVDF